MDCLSRVQKNTDSGTATENLGHLHFISDSVSCLCCLSCGTALSRIINWRYNIAIVLFLNSENENAEVVSVVSSKWENIMEFVLGEILADFPLGEPAALRSLLIIWNVGGDSPELARTSFFCCCPFSLCMHACSSHETSVFHLVQRIKYCACHPAETGWVGGWKGEGQGRGGGGVQAKTNLNP